MVRACLPHPTSMCSQQHSASGTESQAQLDQHLSLRDSQHKASTAGLPGLQQG